MGVVGAVPQDTRDAAGKERFLVFPVAGHVQGAYPKWYLHYDTNGSLKVPISIPSVRIRGVPM